MTALARKEYEVCVGVDFVNSMAFSSDSGSWMAFSCDLSSIVSRVVLHQLIRGVASAASGRGDYMWDCGGVEIEDEEASHD